MEPIHTLEGFIPVDIAGLRHGDGRPCAVIDHAAGKLVCAAFDIVDAKAAVSGDDAGGINAEAAQLADAGVCDGVIGQDRQKADVHAVVRERHGHVGLAAAEGSFQIVIGQQPRHSRRFQAEHNLTECQNFHLRPSLLLQQMHGKAAELIFEVCNCHMAVFVLCRAFVICKSLLCKLCHRQLHRVGADCNMTVLALEHRLHDLDAARSKHRRAAVFDRQVKRFVQLLAHCGRRCGIFAVDADVRDLKAERGASRLLAERGDLLKIARRDVCLRADPAAADGMNERCGDELADVLAVDATGRDEFDPAERSRTGPSSRTDRHKRRPGRTYPAVTEELLSPVPTIPKVQTVLKNNLISLLDTVFSNVNRLFSSLIRGDGAKSGWTL